MKTDESGQNGMEMQGMSSDQMNGRTQAASPDEVEEESDDEIYEPPVCSWFSHDILLTAFQSLFCASEPVWVSYYCLTPTLQRGPSVSEFRFKSLYIFMYLFIIKYIH